MHARQYILPAFSSFFLSSLIDPGLFHDIYTTFYMTMLPGIYVGSFVFLPKYYNDFTWDHFISALDRCVWSMLTETAARCCVKEKENQKEGKKKK
jgi:hypothetical protein